MSCAKLTKTEYAQLRAEQAKQYQAGVRLRVLAYLDKHPTARIKEICYALDLPHERVAQVVWERRPKRLPKSGVVRPAAQELRALLEKRPLSLKEISAHYGVPCGTMGCWLSEMNVSLKAYKL